MSLSKREMFPELFAELDEWKKMFDRDKFIGEALGVDIREFEEWERRGVEVVDMSDVTKMQAEPEGFGQVDLKANEEYNSPFVEHTRVSLELDDEKRCKWCNRLLQEELGEAVLCERCEEYRFEASENNRILED